MIYDLPLLWFYLRFHLSVLLHDVSSWLFPDS